MRSWKLKRSLESFYLNKILWNYITSMQDFYDGSGKNQLMMLKPSLIKNFDQKLFLRFDWDKNFWFLHSNSAHQIV